MKLVLCRHGQTSHNVGNLCSGSNGVGLSEYGILQAHTIGVALKQLDVTKLFCSDLPRAIETASIVAPYISCEPSVCTELRERSFGIFEGQPGDALRADLAVSGLSPEMYQPQGGESYQDVLDRARSFLEILKREKEHQNVAVIAHGNFNCALLTLWKGGSPCDVKQDSACINVIEYATDGHATITLLNSIEHLANLTKNANI